MNDGCFLGPGTIRTSTGKTFNVIAPRPEDVDITDITDIAHALSLTCRFSGQCREFYSVAQHSVLVSRLVPPGLALAGLLHDAHEAYLADLSRPVKQAMPVEVAVWWAQVVHRLDVAIGSKFGLLHGWENDRGLRYADDLACAAEGRDLMTGWDNRGLPDPKDVPVIQPWPHGIIASAFLTRFEELTGK